MLTITAHGKAIDNAAIVERLNDLQRDIYAARADKDIKRFEYCSGVYDGYREALAAMGYSVTYDATNTIIGIEAR